MSSITMGELGQAEAAFAAAAGQVISSLAEAGASAYSTYANYQLGKKDQKARQQEVNAILAQRQREAEMLHQQKMQQQQYEAVTGQIATQKRDTLIKYGLGVIAVLGAGAVLFGALRR